MKIILEIILIIAALVAIHNQIKLEIEGKKIKAEVEESNKLQREENSLLKAIFSEQIRELKERVRADDVTSI